MAEIPTKTFERMPEAAPAGGFLVNDEKAIADQRGVVWELIKQLGKAVTEGASLTRIAIPVNVAEPRTYLQRICDGWCYAPIFLTKAAQTSDPIERLKWVITFAVSGLSNTVAAKKPFNPVIGETFEATYEDGTEVYCEQSSHHPPITNWEVIGPDNLYHFYGHGELTASFRGNSVRGRQLGAHIVEFQDGGKIEYHLPDIWVRGVMWGDRILEYDGEMTFKDAGNNLFASFKFNPDAEGWFWSAKAPNDHFKGGIFKTTPGSEAKQLIMPIHGSWLSCLEFGGEKTWTFKHDLVKHVPNPVETPLPSDCRYREDSNALKGGDLEKAAEWKRILEEKQRAESKLRKQYAEAHGFEPREH